MQTRITSTARFARLPSLAAALFTASCVHHPPANESSRGADASVTADLIERVEFTSSSKTAERPLESPAHRYAGIRVTNEDERGGAVQALRGSVRSLADEPIELVDVRLFYAHGPLMPTGTEIALDGNRFTVSGFDPLSIHCAYDLRIELREVPSFGYEVLLQSSY